MTAVVTRSDLPLPLLRRGKVREVYEIDADTLLLVASDRISAFDIVMREAIPDKGRVLTQISAWWFRLLAPLGPSHFLTADSAEIVDRVPVLAAHRAQLAGRSMLVRRTEPVAFECVVRGYLSGSAWVEYRDAGTMAGEPLPTGLLESSRLPEPLFTPATKAESGHDINVTFDTMAEALGTKFASELRARSQRIYAEGSAHADQRGIIIADTKFEFGRAADGSLLLIDEVLTPDSSRFWPKDGYAPGRGQPSFDKQPLRDWLLVKKRAGEWNGEAPPPTLLPEVVAETSRRYRDAYQRVTGTPLPEGA